MAIICYVSGDFLGSYFFAQSSIRLAHRNSRPSMMSPGITKIQPGMMGRINPATPTSNIANPATTRKSRNNPLLLSYAPIESV